MPFYFFFLRPLAVRSTTCVSNSVVYCSFLLYCILAVFFCVCVCSCVAVIVLPPPDISSCVCSLVTRYLCMFYISGFGCFS
ncbi:hypothetical protein BDZ91DRAFT_754500 [Kalaharituber pfeilii]|nr:hypothetical protein BDZ91DRAFT_754500 [Kalaharituber pfeilii]